MDTHSDSDITTDVPSPAIEKKSGPSLVWLVPVITAIIGGWLIFKTLSEKGPEITVTFKSAEGIEAGKTKIKYKEIDIGLVKSVRFSKDFSHVILKVDIDKEAELFLRRGSRFWVVKPRLSMRGVANLSTLLSGVFIEIEPGQGAPHRHFIGLDEAPVVKADVEGKKIVLLSKKLGSIGTGSPIYYQGILTGEVLGHELGNDRKSVFIHAFIKSPYDELVRSNTRFWNVSGVDISVGAEGINMRTESVQSILFGGIAFDTPNTLERAKEDVEGLVFTLYDSIDSIQEKAFTKKIIFILFFEGSVRGLNVDAPVEFKGIKVGSVVDIRLEFDSTDTSFRIPVLIEVEPERIIERVEGKVTSPYKTLKKLVDRGLRARLQTGSLLTGQLFVELDMHPDTPVQLVYEGGSYPELPTIPASLEQMTTSVKNILAKLEELDLDKVVAEMLGILEGANKLINAPELIGTVKGTNKLLNAPELMKTVKGVNKLVNAPELHSAVRDLKGSMKAFKSVLRKLDKRVEPLTVNLDKAIVAGNQALEKAQHTLGLVDKVLKPDSPLQFRFIQLAEELAETARSIRTLVDLLERNPDSILFGKNSSGGR